MSKLTGAIAQLQAFPGSSASVLALLPENQNVQPEVALRVGAITLDGASLVKCAWND